MKTKLSNLELLQIYKLITEYQIQWLSTSYEIPNLSYTLITKAFPNIDKDTAVECLNLWLSYESNVYGISVYNKSRFNDDTNVDTILKLKNLEKQLDERIVIIQEQIQKENPKSKDEKSNLIEVVKEKDGKITITFLNPKAWFNNKNIVILSEEAAKELFEKLKVIL